MFHKPNTLLLVPLDPSVLAGSWAGHTDAVWGLAYSGIKSRLLSCSADGSVKLWNPTEKNPCISTFNTNKGETTGSTERPPEEAAVRRRPLSVFVFAEHGIPTSVDFNGCDPAHMVASFNSGDVVVYDLETSQQALVLKGQGDGGKTRSRSLRGLHEWTRFLKCCFCVLSCSALPGSNHINKVVSHPTLPVTITAHEDRHIKFYDNKSGESAGSMWIFLLKCCK